MHLWIVVMIILLGAAVMTMDRYDVWVRILIWFLIGWFVLGALLLGYRGEHLCSAGLRKGTLGSFEILFGFSALFTMNIQNRANFVVVE